MGRLARLGAPLAALALVLAAALRFYDLGSNPPGLWQDEASTGVDAYLLWHTGADRAGARLPLISRSFGDYPFALYRYLAAPIVGLLGPSPAAERAVSSILSFGLVLAVVIVLRRRFGPAAALGGALSAAICPTWIHLARYGSEQILLPATLAFGLALFELGREAGRRKYLWLGAISLGLAAYSYHAAKVLLPLWMLGFLVYEWPLVRALWREERRHVLGPALLFVAIVVPSVMLALTPEGNARARDAAVFYRKSGPELVAHVARMYLHYLSPRTLFAQGADFISMSPPGLGLWSWLDALLVPVGLAAAWRARAHRRLALFFVYWFLIGPVPGALGYEENSVTRLIGWLPAPAALAGLGYEALISTPALARFRAVIAVLVAALFLASATWVADRVLVEYPRRAQREWQYEISAALSCAKAEAARREPRPQIVVSPGFTYAEVFAQFWYLPLPKLPDGQSAYRVEWRRELDDGELYAAPAGERVPGVAVCEIRLFGQSEPAARVWAPK